MSKKKEAKELSAEEQIDAGIEWGEELHIDLHRSTQTLDEDGQEVVAKTREALMCVLGAMTSSVPPEPTQEHLQFVHDHCKHAIYFRNVIRGLFLQSEGYDLPEKWERVGGSVH